MELLILSLQNFWQEVLSMAPRILIALGVVALSYVLGRYLARLASMALRRSSLQQLHHRFFRVAIIMLSVFAGTIIALNVLGLEKVAVSMLAGGGVTAVVLGFAFREIGENFLAGLFLTFSRPFNVGDLIATGEIEGTVKDIELRYTHIRTDDGRDAFVPSSQLFNSPVINTPGTASGAVHLPWVSIIQMMQSWPATFLNRPWDGLTVLWPTPAPAYSSRNWRHRLWC